jgi:hypothetical protein
MDRRREPAGELLDVVRVLLLVQGAILVATTIESLIWSAAFPGAAAVPTILSGAAALATLIARTGLRAKHGRSRRVVYAVEIALLVTFAIDTALAIAITGAVPPVMALLTRFVLPLSVIALLRRSARAAEVTPDHAQDLGVAA